MKLTLPAGFKPPRDTKAGTRFDVIATIRQSGDGEYELLAVDGTALSGDQEELEDDDEAPEAETEAPEAATIPGADEQRQPMPWG